MASFKFLHAADLHLDSPLRGLPADAGQAAVRIRGATREALAALVAAAKAEQVAFVLLAGDLFDGDWQDWRTGHFLTGQLAELTRAGIRVIAIRGNHDAESNMSRGLTLPDGAIMLPSDVPGSVALDEQDTVVHGRSFATRAVTENIALGYPAAVAGRFNIGLLHTACGDTGHENYAPCTAVQLAGHGYDYWALGHVHAPAVLHRNPWIVFPGNLQGRHANETGAKGAMLVTVTDGRVAHARPLAFDVVRWARVAVDVTGAADEEAVLQAVRRELETELAAAGGRLLAARLTLTGATAAHAALTRSLVETRGKLAAEAAAIAGLDALWLEQATVATRPALDIDALKARGDAVGRLARAIAELGADALQGPVHDYAVAMLGRGSAVSGVLASDHVARAAAAGALPDDLIERARALLLARLAEP